jgi:hypothetical protein
MMRYILPAFVVAIASCSGPDTKGACEDHCGKLRQCYAGHDGYDVAVDCAEKCEEDLDRVVEDCQEAYVSVVECLQRLECSYFFSGGPTMCDDEWQKVDDECPTEWGPDNGY